jgi:hypothetical protein
MLLRLRNLFYGMFGQILVATNLEQKVLTGCMEEFLFSSERPPPPPRFTYNLKVDESIKSSKP